MRYPFSAIPDSEIPRAPDAAFQHLVDTYTSETNKVAATWHCFGDADFAYRPHPKSSTVLEILRHQLLSERRFFGEFLDSPEPPADSVLPPETTVDAFTARLTQLASGRLPYLASRNHEWWLADAPFFGERRQRIWIFWRRVLHTAHHRTQLSVYLRLLGREVPSTYGPTADVTWQGADPTTTVDAAGRKGPI
jgi:uncharacterized damage-inducible protein DinB